MFPKMNFIISVCYVELLFTIFKPLNSDSLLNFDDDDEIFFVLPR